MSIFGKLFKLRNHAIPSQKRTLPSIPPYKPTLLFSNKRTWAKERPLAKQIIDVTAWAVYELHKLSPDSIMVFGDIFKKTPFYNPKNTPIERENSLRVFFYALGPVTK
jgi:hypothetical protein